MRVDRTVDYVLRICPSNYMRVAVNNFLREIFEGRERQRERRRGYKIGAFVAAMLSFTQFVSDEELREFASREFFVALQAAPSFVRVGRISPLQ